MVYHDYVLQLPTYLHNKFPFVSGYTLCLLPQVYAFGLTIKTGYLEGFAMTLVADVAPALQAHHEAVSKHPKVINVRDTCVRLEGSMDW